MNSTQFDINLKEKLEEARNEEKDFQIVNTFLNLNKDDDSNILDGIDNIDNKNLQKKLFINKKFSPWNFFRIWFYG